MFLVVYGSAVVGLATRIQTWSGWPITFAWGAVTLASGVIGSKSVKTTESGGSRGYDAGKKINRRKCHILTDACGFLVSILMEQSDEWAVQRARYMTLETMAPLSDNPIITLSAITGA